MPKDKLKEFDIATGQQMRSLLPQDRRRRPVLRSQFVPDALRDLIPVVEEWGISCDVTRHEVADQATDEELAYVSATLATRHQAIYDFLYEDHPEECTGEIAAFQALLIFELEECDGPGIPGELDYWLARYTAEPGPLPLQRLESAYRSRIKCVTKPSDRRFWEPALSQAEEILGVRDA